MILAELLISPRMGETKAGQPLRAVIDIFSAESFRFRHPVVLGLDAVCFFRSGAQSKARSFGSRIRTPPRTEPSVSEMVQPSPETSAKALAHSLAKVKLKSVFSMTSSPVSVAFAFFYFP